MNNDNEKQIFKIILINYTFWPELFSIPLVNIFRNPNNHNQKINWKLISDDNDRVILVQLEN